MAPDRATIRTVDEFNRAMAADGTALRLRRYDDGSFAVIDAGRDEDLYDPLTRDEARAVELALAFVAGARWAELACRLMRADAEGEGAASGAAAAPGPGEEP